MGSLYFFLAFAASAAASPGIQAHYLNIGSGGQSLNLAADGAGHYFVVSTVVEPSGRSRIRATKTDSQGNILATLDFGGSRADTPAAAATDSKGNLLIAGATTSADFPVASPQIPSILGSAAFVVKLDSGLTRILASTLLGGKQYASSLHYGTSGTALALDRADNVYLAGGTDAEDFPVTPGAFQTRPPGSIFGFNATYSFVAGMSPDLARIAFATYFGGDHTNCIGGSGCIGVVGHTFIESIALDASGAIVTAGNTSASDLPVTPGSYSTRCRCSKFATDGFLAKFSFDGSKLVWSTYLPLTESSVSSPYGVIALKTLALDRAGNPVVGGSAPDGFPVTPGVAGSAFPLGQQAGFVTKMDASGTRLLFSTYFGGGFLAGSVAALAVDAADRIWLTGRSDPALLPVIPLPPPLGAGYVASLAPDASSVTAVYVAPEGAAGQALSLDPAGAVVVLGALGSLLLPASAGAPSVLGVANAAGQPVSGTVAPAELISLYGYDLGPSPPLAAQLTDGLVSAFLGGYQVLFNGVPAPLLYVGANQINCVVPAEVYGVDRSSLSIVTPRGTFSGPSFFIAPSQPEIFHDPNGFALAFNQDQTVNSASNPAAPGSIISSGPREPAPNPGRMEPSWIRHSFGIHLSRFPFCTTPRTAASPRSKCCTPAMRLVKSRACCR
ncbi:MAG TPA: hypothetical protein VJ732_05600 [Bryobacteraceae bacterium]|nr:hypothetical protein [Bryobacteraceae bacterium]